jgi:hypothetical protein
MITAGTEDDCREVICRGGRLSTVRAGNLLTGHLCILLLVYLDVNHFLYLPGQLRGATTEH